MNSNNKTHEQKKFRIGVLGCGWLGLPLAEKLVDEGHFVRGSTTTKEKIPLMEEAGIEPYYLRIDPRVNGDDAETFFDVDTIVLNIPPPRVQNKISFMLQQTEALISCMNRSPSKKLIMISSTGVYGFQNQHVTETDPHLPETENGWGLRSMERMLMEKAFASTIIIRMAGLIGPKRHPGRFLSGQVTTGNGEEPVNLIHLVDAIGVIQSMICHPEISGVFNACSPEHPTRRDFYTKAAEIFGMDPPVFSDPFPRPWKKINSDKIRQSTGYRFTFYNPIAALKDL